MTPDAHDSLVLLFMETRQQRPPVWDGEAWQRWLASIAQVIAAYQRPERRWGAIVLIADDLQRAMPGLSLALAYGAVEEAVRQAAFTRIHS